MWVSACFPPALKERGEGHAPLITYTDADEERRWIFCETDENLEKLVAKIVETKGEITKKLESSKFAKDINVETILGVFVG
jgi:hypothetical protein